MAYVAYAKLSKKNKRALDRQKRGVWGAINPVTRKSDNPKAYKREKRRYSPDEAGVFFCP